MRISTINLRLVDFQITDDYGDSSFGSVVQALGFKVMLHEVVNY
jgi:hypothetical protein